MSTDMLDRPLLAGDYVVFHNAIYRVMESYKNGYVRIMLWNPSPTTRPVKKYGQFMFKIHAEDITMWILKNEKV